MAFKKWEVGTADKERAKMLAAECEIDDFSALIALSRGIDDPGELELMLSDEPLLCEPRELADISVAADFLNNAVFESKKIAVFGDYDCDGVTATAIMLHYLRSRGANVTSYIPDRVTEGYGMSKSAVLQLHNDGVQVIVTVDNGISCYEEIEYAKTLGIDVVVTDHHLPPERLPDAIAVVDPHRLDCHSSFKEVCGAQVAFKLVCVMEDKEPEQLLYRYGDLLAVAVMGDVMPLVNENRSIVKYGLRMLKSKPRTGISALMNSAGIERGTLNSQRISFGIVPRINTAGRMGSASLALELLLSDDMMSALKMAGVLEDQNTLRQKTEKEIFNQAIFEIEQNGYNYNRVIVVSGENWHLGVIGIVASRICERYSKPAVVLSVQGDMAHGSGRSYEGFQLYDAIAACSEVTEKYGGHALAAGVSLKTVNIEQFRKTINEYALGIQYVPPTFKIDLKLNPAVMSVDMVHDIKIFEPFGPGNPVPLFGIFGVRLENITELSGGKHLKLMFKKGDIAFQALLFSVSVDKFCFEVGDLCDIAVCMDINVYKENCTLSVQIKAIRLCGEYTNELFNSVTVFDDYISGYNVETKGLLPSRDEIAAVYRKIVSSPISVKRMEYLFMDSIGYAKTGIILKILTELGLAVYENSSFYAAPVRRKTELVKSATFRALKGGDTIDGQSN